MICTYVIIKIALQNMSYVLIIELCKRNSFTLELPLLLDLSRIVFILTVSLIAARVYLFSASYMSNEKFNCRFNCLVAAFICSIILIIISPNIIRVLIG